MRVSSKNWFFYCGFLVSLWISTCFKTCVPHACVSVPPHVCVSVPPHVCVSVPPRMCVSDFFITHLKFKLRKKALSAQLEDTFWYFTCISTKFPFYGTYLEKVNYDSIRATKHILCPNVSKSFWQNTSDNSTLCLLYIGFTSKISTYTDENWQRRPKNRENLLFWGDKFLVIPILTSKYMACLPNATFSNNENVPGTTLWVTQRLSFMIYIKNYFFVQNNMKISSGQNIFNFLFFGAPSFSNNSKLGPKHQLKDNTLIYPSL